MASNLDIIIRTLGADRARQEMNSLTDRIKRTSFSIGGLNLRQGVTGSGEYHPFGDTATYVEHTFTKATVMEVTENGGPANVVILDVVLGLDDLTTGAAA